MADTAHATRLAEPNVTTPELQQEVEQFLYAEARMQDERRFHDWLDIIADDIRYFMPVRFNRLRREMDHEFSRDDEVALFDETKDSLLIRIKRLDTGMAWAEEPPSRTRHMVHNVQVTPIANPNELEVGSYFFLYRSRLERQVDLFVGCREDLLRRANNDYGFEIAKRTIYLDQTMVLANNLSMFF